MESYRHCMSQNPKICKSCSTTETQAQSFHALDSTETRLLGHRAPIKHNSNRTVYSDSGNTPSLCMDSEGNIIASGNDLLRVKLLGEGTPTGNEYSDGDATSEITCTGITGNVFVASSCDNNAT